MTSYNGASYSWQGRELRKITSGSNTYSYKYDADGIRTSKTVNGTKTEFFLNGSQILAQKTGDTTMLFFYDSTGKRVGFSNGDTLYYYLYNVQGDVVTIMRAATGQIVAKYSYDAWGKCTVTNASGYTVGEKNPFRYRGYYYDTETGLYYLNSRYYSPEFGRFISADSLIDNRGANSQNLFAYCHNNPVNVTDSTGHLPFFVFTAIIGAVAGAIVGGVRAANSGNSVWKGALSGAAIGGAIGLGAGAAAGAALAGSAAASTGSVLLGAQALATTVESAGVVGGAKMIADNISQTVTRNAQVFWSGGDTVKNAAKQVANSVGGKTLEMTRVGIYLEKTNAPYSAWQAASANFANVAVNASPNIYSVQNAAGIRLQSIWATVEYPVLQGKEIAYGVVQQNGIIKFMP